MSDPAGEPRDRAVWCEVDLDAIRHNVRVLREIAAPAALLAVVKANAYGHGAVPVAQAALDAGASWLGVARVEEGVQLREAGIDAPVLLLSEAPAGAADIVLAHGITPVVYTEFGIDAVAKSVAAAENPLTVAVHLKVDTGMHRVGCTPDDAVALVEQIAAHDELTLGGVCTHLAVADEPARDYTAEQLAAFDGVIAALEARGLRGDALVHAANSAGTLAWPASRYDLVRAGISVYGIPPSAELAGIVDLRPAMTLTSRVTFVKSLPAGARLSYGLRYELEHEARIATVPAGYADGVPRNLGLAGGEVLIGGRRHSIAGIVTMDQLLVDVGGAPVETGDEVVLLGAEGDDEVTALEWADHLGTISYEIVTGIGRAGPAAVPRMNAGDVLKRAGVVTGVAAGVLGVAYGAERAVVARMRHGDDPDADSPLVPTFDTEIDVDTHDHGVLHVISRGEGPPILFAHGVTLSSRVWAKQFDAVPAAGFRAIAFDARGHGASNVGESGHSVDNLADDVRSVLEALDLHDAILVGHSMGGMAIQAFVIRHPHIAHERARGMVLMSTAPSMPMSDARRVRGALERMAGVTPDVGMLLRQKNLGFLLARVGFGDDPHPSHVEATRQMLAVCSRATLRDSSRALLALDLTGGLPNVTMPTLVLGGTRDAITPLRQSREIAELVPNARLEEFEGAGHMLMYERADDVDKLIIEFARECLV